MSLQDRDSQCIRRLRDGDAAALEELYDRYTPLLYPVALRILRRVSDAEDAVQQAWVQIWKSSASYDPKRGTVAAWLLTVTRTRALDLYRSLASRKRAESQADPELVPPAEPSRVTQQGQIGERVKRALETLPPQQRQVLEIAYFEGLSQSEIARRLGAPLGTVKAWTRQALLRLREQLRTGATSRLTSSRAARSAKPRWRNSARPRCCSPPPRPESRRAPI
jgi:RNA polymerase sigma-70 factor (ECF subfamily)